MTLSIAFVLLGTAAVLGALALALRLGRGTSEQSALELARAASLRLAELEQRAHNDALDAASAEQARIALLQEILTTACGQRSLLGFLGRKQEGLIAIGLGMLVIGCSYLLFLAGGTSTAPADTLAVSAGPQDPDLARLELYAKSAISRGSSVAMSRPQQLPDVETMIERLAARLKVTPDDAEGWHMLGWSYSHVEQAAKAATAYARAVALRPQSSEFKTAYGEAMVAAESGVVTAKSVEIFNAALALDAKDAKARYFLALAMEQSGHKKEALETWLLLQKEPLGDEPWVAELRERTRSLASELNVEAPTASPQPATARAAANAKTERPPTAEEMQSIRALPGDQQQALIRAMVEGLADRLQRAPRDEAGWLRLIRSHVVLGEEHAAREALGRALAAFSDDQSTGARISAAARELGVEKD